MNRTDKMIIKIIIAIIIVWAALMCLVGVVNAEVVCPPTNTPLPTDTPEFYTPTATLEIIEPSITPTQKPTEIIITPETPTGVTVTATDVPGEFTSVPPPPKSTIGPPIERPTVTPTATATAKDRPKADKTPVMFPVTGEGKPDDNIGLWIFGAVLFCLGILMILVSKRAK